MENFVRLTAPSGKIDFAIKLLFFMLIGGGLNHLRHVLTHGFPGNKTFFVNFAEAGFTTLPMCAFALLLIGHLHSLQKRLYWQATRDQLTELPNRRWFMDKTPIDIPPTSALMIIDVDHFKRINDEHGHDVGDRCLQRMADHLRSCLGETNKFARIGGEEFAVFMPDADLQTIHSVAGKLSAGFLFEAGADEIRKITASVGISFAPVQQSRLEAFQIADQATYSAKAKGRACYVITTDAPQGVTMT